MCLVDCQIYSDTVSLNEREIKEKGKALMK
jgi:hypothetical protein